MSAPTLTAGATCAADLSALLRARNPLVWCVTREEARTKRIILEAAAAAGYAPVFWDCASGLTDISGEVLDGSLSDPAAVLAAIRDSRGKRQAWVLLDLAPWLRDPTVTRALRSLCGTLPNAKRDDARAIVVVTPDGTIPPELQGDAKVVDVPLPDRAEVASLLDASIAGLPEELRATAAPNGTRDAAIDAAVGLSAEEAQSTFARSLILTKSIDPAAVAKEKRRVVSRERVLEWCDPLSAGLSGVGGLELLKGWLSQRRSAFSARARAYGLRPPKGALLVGVPGCGKSLCAKAIAAAWGMPLLRLDLGALKSKFVGESEGNIRRALAVAETVAPAVLWIDELEKALGGATGGGADGGVSTDALGAILSWMQDRAGSVFVIATANDVTKLPPELLRKGRFDEVWFVDLPTSTERAAILRASLREYGRDPTTIDVEAVAAAAGDFSGAELSALVPDAMFAAFADGERAIATGDLVRAASNTVPLAKTAGDKLAALRTWAQGRARPASAPETTSTPDARRALDI